MVTPDSNASGWNCAMARARPRPVTQSMPIGRYASDWGALPGVLSHTPGDSFKQAKPFDSREEQVVLGLRPRRHALELW